MKTVDEKQCQEFAYVRSGGARILLLGIPAFQANELKGESE